MNCIPVIPNAETPFGTMTEPNAPLIEEVRNNVRKHILVMSHCSRCRADAVGLLGKDLENKNELLKEFSLKPITMDNSRTRVAIATEEGILVNQHLGEAERFQIFEQQGDDYNLIEVREAPRAGLGDFRWLDLSKQLKDCKAILVGSAGPNPVSILESTGLKVIQMTGLINQGLDHVYKGTALLSVKKAENFNCSSGGGCKGNAMGCG